MDFRAEMYNPNVPPLGSPNVVLGSTGFGSITSVGDLGGIQPALKANEALGHALHKLLMAFPSMIRFAAEATRFETCVQIGFDETCR